jgi:hypothetical protein
VLTASSRRLGFPFPTLWLLFLGLRLKVYPAVVVRNHAASLGIVVVIQIRRKNDSLWLGLLPWPWHGRRSCDAYSVTGASSTTAGVGYRSPHEEPPGGVEERQAASLGLCSHDRHDLVDALGLAALVASPGVHLCRLGAAGARRRRLDAKPLQELGKLGAGAVADGLRLFLVAT